jgi:hypothetical protein
MRSDRLHGQRLATTGGANWGQQFYFLRWDHRRRYRGRYQPRKEDELLLSGDTRFAGLVGR